MTRGPDLRRLPVGLPGAVLLAVLAAATIRSPSFWVDEAASAWTADRPLGQLLGIVGREEANLGPYYLVLNAWVRLGTSDAWLRLLSVPFAVATVLLTAEVARRWTNRAAVGVAAGLAAAVLPAVRHMVVEARGYSWVMACAALALFAVERTPDGRARVRPIILGVGVGLAVALNITAITAVAGPLTLVVAAGSLRSESRRLGLAGLVALALVLPFTVAYSSNPTQASWIALRSFGEAYRVSLQTTPGLTGFVWASVLSCIVVGALVVVRRRRTGHAPGDAALVLAAGVGALTPFLGLYLGSLIVQPMFISRYASAAAPSLALSVVLAPWLVTRWAAARSTRTDVGTATAVAVSSAALVLAVGSFAWRAPGVRSVQDDPRGATEFLVERIEPGDIVILTDRWYWWWASRYGLAGIDVPVYSAAEPATGGLETLDPGAVVRPISEADVAGARRVWWVQRPIRDGSGVGSLGRVADELAASDRRVRSRDFDGIVVVLYGPLRR